MGLFFIGLTAAALDLVVVKLANCLSTLTHRWRVRKRRLEPSFEQDQGPQVVFDPHAATVVFTALFVCFSCVDS